MKMVFTTGSSNRLSLKCHYLEIISQAAPTFNRVKPFHELRILRGNTRRVLAFVPIIIGSGSGSQFVVLCLPFGVIVSEGYQCCSPNGHSIGS